MEHVMTTKEQSLDGLIERVKAATGPDRDLDAAIATTAGGYVYEKRDRDRKAWFYPIDGRSGRKDMHGTYGALPRYTASIDAALALVERCLPGQNTVLTRQGDRWFSVFTEGADHTWLPEHPPIGGPTLPLVILLALLSAMVSNEETLDGL